MRRISIRYLTEGALIAALYVALTWLSSLVGLASGAIQFRLSEALCVLAAFTPAAIPGLAIGCALANLLTGSLPLDILFGSLATLLGALVCWLTRRFGRLWAPVPNILSNTVIVPLVLMFVYQLEGGFFLLALGVFIGEFVCGGLLGLAVHATCARFSHRLFPQK